MTSDLHQSDIVTGVILVDHGSRRAESNQMLHDAVERFRAQSAFAIVEPAHMELAQPDLSVAFQRCVEQGVRRVVVFPYFLSPGRHWNEDIPALVRRAADPFPDVEWVVTAPFGLHPGMNAIIEDRIHSCLSRTFPADDASHATDSSGCDLCGPQLTCLNRNSSRVS
ncbi:MAG: hypothetical protein KDA85_00010 [Planctomycetaceae bacterium]|nr:hypothetical protein [Planctomycetaceae bacterium]